MSGQRWHQASEIVGPGAEGRVRADRSRLIELGLEPGKRFALPQYPHLERDEDGDGEPAGTDIGSIIPIAEELVRILSHADEEGREPSLEERLRHEVQEMLRDVMGAVRFVTFFESCSGSRQRARVTAARSWWLFEKQSECRLQDMAAAIKRQVHRDARGRRWEIALVPLARAAAEDARFWWEELTPEQRVEAVETCLESALKARGIPSVPRLRRTARVVKRRGR